MGPVASKCPEKPTLLLCSSSLMQDFVNCFMQDPDPSLRWKEMPMQAAKSDALREAKEAKDGKGKRGTRPSGKV